MVLDTSVLIAVERGAETTVLNEFDFVIPTPVLAEFEYGLRAMPAQLSDRGWKILQGLMAISEIAEFDAKAASKYAELKNTLRKLGKPRSEMDLLIAATAASMGLQLLSIDRKAQFESIPGVRLHPLSHKLHW